MPASYVLMFIGKITAYLFVCLMQCLLMLSLGVYLMPQLGLPALSIGSNGLAIMTIAICTGLAATSYGIFVGTLFRTHQQASTFGAVSVVIFAALGGIWVPVYVMPDVLRSLSCISPLSWALEAFHRIFISNASLIDVWPAALKLFSFFISFQGCLNIIFMFHFLKN